MLFRNLQISPESLPQIEEVEFQKLDEDYLWMRLISKGLFFLVLFGILTIIYFVSDIGLWTLMGPAIALMAIVFFVEIRGFKIKGFALREKDLSYRKGLIFFSMVSIPFNRIQHCELNQGPLGKLFDLASVKVYTAGGSSSDLNIGGLSKDTAHRLRDHITSLSARHE